MAPPVSPPSSDSPPVDEDDPEGDGDLLDDPDDPWERDRELDPEQEPGRESVYPPDAVCWPAVARAGVGLFGRCRSGCCQLVGVGAVGRLICGKAREGVGQSASLACLAAPIARNPNQ